MLVVGTLFLAAHGLYLMVDSFSRQDVLIYFGATLGTFYTYIACGRVLKKLDKK